MSDQSALERVHLLTHRPAVRDDAARPFEHALALGGEALKPRAALHQHHPELILELLDAGGKRGLADVAHLGGAAEVLLAGERNDEFKLVDHALRRGP